MSYLKSVVVCAALIVAAISTAQAKHAAKKITKLPESKLKGAAMSADATTNESKFYSFTVKDAKAGEVKLADYKDKVVLVVNVASRCGYTGQYEGLQKLYSELGPKGFVILGFPSNQFLGQEPGTDAEIQSFCKLNYDVSFPVFAKVDVNGDAAIPLYKWLTGLEGFSGKISWNFNKFLLNRKGEVIQRYPSGKKPEEIVEDIKKLL